MTREILPTTDDGLDERIDTTWASDTGTSQTITKTGPADTLQDEYDELTSTGLSNTYISSVSLSTFNGRGTYKIFYTGSEDDDLDDENGLQELLAIDVVRPIYAAPYFSELTYEEIGDVRRSVQKGQKVVDAGWADKQKYLFYHIVIGRTKYYETGYVFRKTFKTTSGQQVMRSAGNINTVQELPTLSSTMQNLIDGLPTGEWLKRPTQVRYVGTDGWEVSEEYLWAVTWSIVYGGTFTGV